MTTLSYERGILALGRQARFETELSRAIEHYISAQDEPVMDQRVAELFVELQIMRYHGLKTISNYVNNDGKIGPEASLQKLYWSELRSKLGNFIWICKTMRYSPINILHLQMIILQIFIIRR